MAIFYGLAVYTFSFFIKNNLTSLILIFSLIFGVVEFIRGNILTGFPWNLIAFSLSKNLEFIQILSIFGTYGFNMICITIFLSPVIFIMRKKKKEIFICFFILLITIFFWLFGESKIKKKKLINDKKKDYLIKIISPKVEIGRFYIPDNEKEIIEDLIKLSQPEADIPTIFIWPEGMFTSTYLKDIKKYEYLFQKNFSKKHLIIFGINEAIYEKDELKIYNTLSIVNQDLKLENVYYKNNLVPFGEFLPFEHHLSKLGLRSITNNYQSFSKGSIREPIKLNNEYFDLSFLPLICYEIIYSGNLSKNNNYDLIINISEDGWFGNSIGPYQHFSHSTFRAIEEGKNIIRATNNGISGHIDTSGILNGDIKSTLGSVIKINGYKKSTKTLFSRYGNKMFFYLLIIYISFIFFINRGRIKK